MCKWAMSDACNDGLARLTWEREWERGVRKYYAISCEISQPLLKYSTPFLPQLILLSLFWSTCPHNPACGHTFWIQYLCTDLVLSATKTNKQGKEAREGSTIAYSSYLFSYSLIWRIHGHRGFTTGPLLSFIYNIPSPQARDQPSNINSARWSGREKWNGKRTPPLPPPWS